MRCLYGLVRGVCTEVFFKGCTKDVTIRSVRCAETVVQEAVLAIWWGEMEDAVHNVNSCTSRMVALDNCGSRTVRSESN